VGGAWSGELPGGWPAILMEGVRRWSVESKKFELSIRGGSSGVRLVERSKNKQGSIFIRRDEIAWLARSVEIMVDVGTSEVFWDQSRASYPRLLVQKCYNSHGRYMIIEERDGRRRCGIILIPEGWHGQGWARIISELRRVKEILLGDNVSRGSKAAKVIPGRSFAEVVQESAAPANSGGGYRKVSALTQNQRVPATDIAASAGSMPFLGSQAGVLSGAPVILGKDQASTVPAMHDVGAAYTGFQEKVMRQQEMAFNAKVELVQCREWLRRVRGEVDAGIGRIDAVIKKWESFGPGQGSLSSGWVPKPTKRTKRFIKKGPGPDTSKDKLKAKIQVAGEGLSHGPDIMKPGPVTAGEGPSYGPDVLKLGPIPTDPVFLNKGEPSSFSHQRKARNQEKGRPASEGEPGNSGAVSDAPDLLAEEGGRRYTTAVSFMPPKFQKSRSTFSASALTLPEGRPAGSGLVTQPSCSWVAGKTGFGPVVPNTGMDTSIPAEDSKGEAGSPAMTAVPQPNIQVTLVEMGEAEQSVPNTVGSSLPDFVSPLGTENIDGVDSTILCSLSGNGLQDEVVSENGLEVSFVEDSAVESGNELRPLGPLGESPPVIILKRKAGVLIEEGEASPIVGRMVLAEEVGGIIGLTCDGQEGLKRECFKQIIIDNFGRGEDNLGTTDQQEAENNRRERGNCSDYEA
jgi:hypothetical protein